MTAPTEAEIRAIVDRELSDGGASTVAVSDAFNLTILDELYDLDELRPSELASLDNLVSSTIAPIRDRAVAEMAGLREDLVAAGLRCVELHPDAPRAAKEGVTA